MPFKCVRISCLFLVITPFGCGPLEGEGDLECELYLEGELQDERCLELEGELCLQSECELCDFLPQPLPGGKPLLRVPAAIDGRIASWEDYLEALQTEAAQALLRVRSEAAQAILGVRSIERVFELFENSDPELAGAPTYVFSNRPVAVHGGLQRDIQSLVDQRGENYRYIDISTSIVETPTGELAVNLHYEWGDRQYYRNGRRAPILKGAAGNTYLVVLRADWLEFHREYYPPLSPKLAEVGICCGWL